MSGEVHVCGDEMKSRSKSFIKTTSEEIQMRAWGTLLVLGSSLVWPWDGSSFAAYQKLLFLSLYFMSVIFTFTTAVKKVFGHITTKRLVVMATESSIGSNASSSVL